MSDLLLVDSSSKVTAEPHLAAFVVEGKRQVGWVMEPKEDTVVVLFSHGFSQPIIIPKLAPLLYRHLGAIVASFNDCPSPGMSTQDKAAVMRRGEALLSN